jgi:hypothetical protein
MNAKHGVIVLAGVALAAAAFANGDYPSLVLGTPGLQAYWQFEEQLDPRLQTGEKRAQEADQEELRGLFFPGGSSLKVAVRLVDATGKHGGRTEEVRTSELGVVGSAFGFSGNNSLVYLFRDPALESGTGDFSLEMWLKPETVDSSAWLAMRQSPLCKGNGGWYVNLSKGQVYFSIRRWADVNFTVQGPEGTLKAGVWQHLVCVRSGGNLHLYVNGAAVASASCPPGFRVPDFGDINLGGSPFGNLYVGLMDEFAYYSTALPPDTIQAHYAAGAP